MVCLAAAGCESIPTVEPSSNAQKYVFTNGIDMRPIILNTLKEGRMTGGIVNEYFDYVLIETGWEPVYNLLDFISALSRTPGSEYDQSSVKLRFYVYESYIVVRGVVRSQWAGNVSFDSMMENGKNNNQKELRPGMKGWYYLEHMTEKLRERIEIEYARQDKI